MIHYWWHCRLFQPPGNTEWRFLWKLKIEVQYNLAAPLLHKCANEMQSVDLHVCVYVALWTTADMEDDEDVGSSVRGRVPVLLGLLFSHNKEWNLSFAATCMELEVITAEGISQRQGAPCYYAVTCVGVFLRRTKWNSTLEKGQGRTEGNSQKLSHTKWCQHTITEEELTLVLKNLVDKHCYNAWHVSK